MGMNSSRLAVGKLSGVWYPLFSGLGTWIMYQSSQACNSSDVSGTGHPPLAGSCSTHEPRTYSESGPHPSCSTTQDSACLFCKQGQGTLGQKAYKQAQELTIRTQASLQGTALMGQYSRATGASRAAPSSGGTFTQ